MGEDGAEGGRRFDLCLTGRVGDNGGYGGTSAMLASVNVFVHGAWCNGRRFGVLAV